MSQPAYLTEQQVSDRLAGRDPKTFSKEHALRLFEVPKLVQGPKPVEDNWKEEDGNRHLSLSHCWVGETWNENVNGEWIIKKHAKPRHEFFCPVDDKGLNEHFFTGRRKTFLKPVSEAYTSKGKAPKTQSEKL